MDLLNNKLDKILKDSLQSYNDAIENSLELILLLLQPCQSQLDLDGEPVDDLVPFDYDQLCSDSDLLLDLPPELDLDPSPGRRSSQTHNDGSFSRWGLAQQSSASPSELGSAHFMDTSLSHPSSSSDPTHRSSPASSLYNTSACSDTTIHHARTKHSQWPLSQSIASARIFSSALPTPPTSQARSPTSCASLPPPSRPRASYTPPSRSAPYPSRRPHTRAASERPK